MAVTANPIAQRDRAEIDPPVAHRQMDRSMWQLRQDGQAGADAVARANGVVDDPSGSVGVLLLNVDLPQSQNQARSFSHW
jgi:hypothetical protein